VKILAEYIDKGLKRLGISISKPMLAGACIISGVMVILFPSFLVWAVGLFLVAQGALLLANHFEQERKITPVTFRGVYCQDCGAENTEESVFCRACGNELAYAVQVIVPQAQEVAQ